MIHAALQNKLKAAESSWRDTTASLEAANRELSILRVQHIDLQTQLTSQKAATTTTQSALLEQQQQMAAQQAQWELERHRMMEAHAQEVAGLQQVGMAGLV